MNNGFPDPIDVPGIKLGLLSDSHTKYERTSRALDLLHAHNPDVLIHLGDICDERVLDVLSTSSVPVRFVWGNMDDATNANQQYAEQLGLYCDHPVGFYRMSGKLIVATHGHLDWVHEASSIAKPDYFLHGHTHLVRDEKINTTRFINPGALQRANQYTVGLLNVEIDEFSVIEVAD